MILFELDFGHGELHRYARYNRQVPKHLIGKDIGCLWKGHIVRVRISKVECSEASQQLSLYQNPPEYMAIVDDILKYHESYK